MVGFSDDPLHSLRRDALEMAARLGVEQPDEAAVYWFSAALCHSSYAFEMSRLLDHAHINGATIGALSGLGQHGLELIVRRELYLRALGELGKIDRLKSMLMNALPRELFAQWGLESLARGNSQVQDAWSTEAMGSAQDSISKQVMGACWASGLLRMAVGPVQEAIETLVRDGADYRDYKTPLQEALFKQGLGPPAYEVIGVDGPQHKKVFRVQVSDKTDRIAQGDGSSKKSSEQAAAREFIQLHLGSAANVSRDAALAARGTRHLPPTRHLPNLPAATAAAVGALCPALDIPRHQASEVASALTHASYRFEHSKHDLPIVDQSRLAWLGSAVVGFLVEARMTEFLVEMTDADTPRKRYTMDTSERSVAEAFDSWIPGSAVALGRGQLSAGLTPTIKADTVQALLGAWCVNRGADNLDVGSLPEPVQQWIEELCQGSIKHQFAGRDHRTALQELCVVLDLPTEFTEEVTGPDHSLRRVAKVKLSTNHRARVAYTGFPSTSKRSAVKSVAEVACRDIMRTLGSDSSSPIESRLSELDAQRARALLGHAIAGLPATIRDASRWTSLGLMGAGCMKQDYTSYFRWLAWASQVLDRKVTRVEYVDLVAFFSTVRGSQSSRFDASLANGLARIGDGIQGLDPTQSRHSVPLRQEPFFEALMDLLRIVRVATQEPRVVPVSDAIDEWRLLARATMFVEPRDGSAEASIREPEGAFGEILSLLAQLEPEQVVLSTEGSGRFVTLALHRGQPLEAIRRTEVWKSIVDTMPVGILKDSGRTTIAIPRHEGDNSLWAAGVEGLTPNPPRNYIELQVIARLLHDIKNHLVAYDVAMSRSVGNRTDHLRQQLEASEHLDHCARLLRDTETVRGSLQIATYEDVALGGFFRDVMLAKMRDMPATTLLVPPTNVSPATVRMPRELVRSVLDNLINNAFEAVRDSNGRVAVEWILDDDYQELLIEVTDSGPGVPQPLLDAVNQGRSVRSVKDGGSGVGLMSAQGVMRRIGGTLEGFSSPSVGTRWELSIPVSSIAREVTL